MTYQNSTRGVVAGGATECLLGERPPQSDELEVLMREGVHQMAKACDAIPSPKIAFHDASPMRARPLSMKKVGSLLVVLSRCKSLPTELLPAFAHRVYAWMLSLRPMAPDSLARTWDRSTLQQATGDVAQARAARAVETGDLAAVDLAIDETTKELALDQVYLERLFHARREIVATRQPSLHAMQS